MEIVSPIPQSLAPNPSSPSPTENCPASSPSSSPASLPVTRRALGVNKKPKPRHHHAAIPSRLARHVAVLIRPRGLMSDKARYDLTWRELVQPVAVRRVTLAVCGHAVEREIGKRHEALRLLVGGGGMRIAPRQPAPRAIVLISLAAVDHDLRHAPLQLLHHPPPPPPLRIATGAVVVEKGVVERVAADAAAPVERDRKSTRLNSSHGYISYAVFCL